MSQTQPVHTDSLEQDEHEYEVDSKKAAKSKRPASEFVLYPPSVVMNVEEGEMGKMRGFWTRWGLETIQKGHGRMERCESEATETI
jgi:hypothetical protein